MEVQDFAQVFVLASDDWDSYLETWEQYPKAIFMRLPDELNCSVYMKETNSGPWKFNRNDSTEHGVGYARLCIQLVAHVLGLDFVWMLDDDIEEAREIDLEHRKHSADRPPKPCKFDSPMRHLESLVDLGQGEQLEKTNMNGSADQWLQSRYQEGVQWIGCNLERCHGKNATTP